MIYTIKNIMSIAVDAPDLLDNTKIKIKNWIENFLWTKEKSKTEVKDILTCNIDKSKSVYTELLKNILDTIHEKDYDSEMRWAEKDQNLILQKMVNESALVLMTKWYKKLWVNMIF